MLKAEPYPSRPIRLIVPWPPGGIADLRARELAARVGPLLGTTMVVENRPGASGTVGMAAAARAPADGYTIALGTVNDLAIAPLVQRDLPYDPLRDFAPITQYSLVPPVLVTDAASGMRSFRELAGRLRAQPGQVRFGTYGPSTSAHLTAEAIGRAVGGAMLIVHYKGGSAAMNALVAHEVDVILDFPLTALPQIEAGRIVPLMIAGPRRVPALPGVPAAPEVGHPGLALFSWGGLLAPAATPAAIVQRLNAAFVQVLHTPEIVREYARTGAQAVGGTPEAFTLLIRDEQVKWAQVAKDAGIEAH